ncbi:MAG: Rieske 2Fe-2S domain-containing protein [Gemmatimonadaceae bacterium]
MTAAADGLVPVSGLKPEQVDEGTLVAVTLANGARLCIGRHQGALFAVKDSCPHSEYPLSEGTLYANGELECCWHGAKFSCVTGEVLRGPAEDPLVRYEIEEREGGMWVRRA